MKVRVIEKGVSDKNDQPLPKGTVIEIPGDVIPASLKNKVVIEETEKTFIANPTKLTKAEKAALAKEREELVESATLLGVAVTDEMTVEEIKAAIAAAGQA